MLHIFVWKKIADTSIWILFQKYLNFWQVYGNLNSILLPLRSGVFAKKITLWISICYNHTYLPMRDQTAESTADSCDYRCDAYRLSIIICPSAPYFTFSLQFLQLFSLRLHATFGRFHNFWSRHCGQLGLCVSAGRHHVMTRFSRSGQGVILRRHSSQIQFAL